MLCSRYMSISDEWETPEKQPFKDFVSVTHCHFNHTFREYPPGVVEGGGKSLLMVTSCFCCQGNMRHWMEDPDCRDQYSVIYESGERTAIFNNDAKDPIVSEERAVSQPITTVQ